MNTNLGLYSKAPGSPSALLTRPAAANAVAGPASGRSGAVAESLPGRPRVAEADAAEISRLARALVAEFDPADRIEKTKQAVAKLNEVMRDQERDLEFSLDEATGRTILKVIHSASGEVIRQIPSEELLQIARTFIEGTGSLIDDQA